MLATAWAPAWPSVAGPLGCSTSQWWPGPGFNSSGHYLRIPQGSFGSTGDVVVGGSPNAPLLYWVVAPFRSSDTNLSSVNASSGTFWTTALPHSASPDCGSINSALLALVRPPASSFAADAVVAFVSDASGFSLNALDGSTSEIYWRVAELQVGGEPAACMVASVDGTVVATLTAGVNGTSPRLRIYNATTGSVVTDLSPPTGTPAGTGCWGLFLAADGSYALSSNNETVTRWDLLPRAGQQPGAGVAWSTPHNMPSGAPPTVPAAIFVVPRTSVVVAAGAGGLVAFDAGSGESLWSFHSGLVVTLMASAPQANGSIGTSGVVFVGLSDGFWSDDVLSALNASTGSVVGSVLHQSCHTIAASAAVQLDGTTVVYSAAACWGTGAGENRPANGYPVYVLEDAWDATSLTLKGRTLLNGGAYAGSLSQVVAIGPGQKLFWPFTGLQLIEVVAST
jgi:hypothetical protein